MFDSIVPFSAKFAARRRPTPLFAEARRRVRLMLEPAPQTAGAPSLKTLLGEFSVIGDCLARLSYNFATAQRPRPVMLLPGLLVHPARMHYMRRKLEQAGHHVHDWGLGMNLGPNPNNVAMLRHRVRMLAERHGEPLALVGWSLGGLFARDLGWSASDSVAMVVTMGSPFSGDMRANRAWRIYQAVAGHRVEDAPVSRHSSAKPPVPTIALWSARDGFIAPRSAMGRPGERDLAMRLRCTHLGFAYSPEAVGAVLQQLDRV